MAVIKLQQKLLSNIKKNSKLSLKVCKPNTTTYTFDSGLQITVVSAMIAFGFLFNALILTPKINHFRDRVNSGDIDAERMFARLHLFSVAIFGSQFFASLYIIISQAYFS